MMFFDCDLAGLIFDVAGVVHYSVRPPQLSGAPCNVCYSLVSHFQHGIFIFCLLLLAAWATYGVG
jgi:hypothetical protein